MNYRSEREVRRTKKPWTKKKTRIQEVDSMVNGLVGLR